MNFSEKLQSLRKLQNMSQEVLAEKLDITRQTVSKWESQQSTPDLDKLIELSKIFEVSIDYLTKQDELDELTIRAERIERKQDDLINRQLRGEKIKQIVISGIAIYMIAFVVFAILKFYFFVGNPSIVIGQFVFATAIILLVNIKTITSLKKEIKGTEKK